MLKVSGAVFRAGGREIPLGQRTLLMAIVNMSPDSFSGDGSANVDSAVKQAIQFAEAGADIIDIGGESTRPGYIPIEHTEEARRVLPVLEALQGKCRALISVDTCKPAIFRAAAKVGASIYNSVAGATDEMLNTAAELGCPVVIMHNKAIAEYDNVVDEVLAYLAAGARKALASGLKTDQIILDPGIGFGKNADHNLAVMGSLEKITALGFPTMLGSSRKSTIGKITGKPVEQRAFGTAATVAIAIACGIDIVRVHDVADIADVIKMSDAILRNWRPEGWENE
jgi:dihydropteroate synthase